MHGPDSLAAAIPGNRSPGERNGPDSGGHDEHRAAATQNDRVSDRQRVGDMRTLPFVLAEDDQIGIAGVGADTIDKIAIELEPPRIG
jgi:hypothetical protein